MVRRKRALTNLDHLIDDLLGENPTPEEILGEGGLVKTLIQRMIERALAGELMAHLKADLYARGLSNRDISAQLQELYGVELSPSVISDDELSVFKLLCLAMKKITQRWNRPIRDWKAAASHLAILF